MKYLAAILLGGCAFVSGPCTVISGLEEKHIICQADGRMIVIPASVLQHIPHAK